MTNFEKWKDELLRLGNDGRDGIACINGKPISCDAISNCCECDFNKGSCDGKFLLWLCEEYTEPKPKLTKREREFCKMFKIPHGKRIGRTPEGEVVMDLGMGRSFRLHDCYFPFIEFNHHWEIVDLLKLEVED